MIEVESLSKSYRDIAAVAEVSFEVGSREMLGLLGPNGAGKTTLLRMLAGTLQPSSGEARIDGHSILSASTEAKQSIGYLPENAPAYEELLVSEQLRFAADAHYLSRSRADGAVERVAERCGIAEVLQRPVRELSRGYRQRLGIAQALVHDPPILILDEPHSGLDPNQMREIRSLLREVAREKAVLLSTHLLGEVEALCERVVLLASGRVVGEGPTQQLIAGSASVRRYRLRVVPPVRLPQQFRPDRSLRGCDEIASVEVLREGAAAVVGESRGKGEGASAGAAATGRREVWVLEVTPAESSLDGGFFFDWAVAHNCRLEGLEEIASGELEQVFAELTAAGSQRAAHEQAPGATR